jgi:hypothetical protein
MCTEMETLAEFLFPCCMAAGCSPETKGDYSRYPIVTF